MTQLCLTLKKLPNNCKPYQPQKANPIKGFTILRPDLLGNLLLIRLMDLAK